MTAPLHTDEHSGVPTAVPQGTLRGLRTYARFDVVAGFLVFLIALPLCLAISLASGYPAIAGVFTAVIGGFLGAMLSNSELAIKGPAAGLIVIVAGCVKDFGHTGGVDPSADFAAYRLALAVGLAAAGLQILFAVLRSGVLGEFFPTSAVHGLLAAIGVIIMAKQIPVAVGVKPEGEPLELLQNLPHTLLQANPEIAIVGLVSLLILFGMPLIPSRTLRRIPAQLVVVLVAMLLGSYFKLNNAHPYSLMGHEYAVGPQHLVNVPPSMLEAITAPDIQGLLEPANLRLAWKWIVMFALIGSLESLISTKAVDLLDPWKRKTNLNRDMLAVGLGNLVASCVGGLPMISEIVRSRANVDAGAHTRFSNLFHAAFLLICVAVLPGVIHLIPLSALAAMLIFTGFRLAHPREFIHVYKIGPEQLLVYCVTVVGVLATDLLIGVALGIVTELIVHFLHGVPARTLFVPRIRIEEDKSANFCRLVACDSAVFSNWIPLRRRIVELGLERQRDILVDLSSTRVVDHTVMERLHELAREFEQQGLHLEVIGLDAHIPLSSHPLSARMGPLKRKIGSS